MYRNVLSLLFAFVLLPASLAWAQQGAVEGQVTDAETGDPLPGVNVVLEGTQRGAATSADGEYRIGNVEPGTYTLSASFVGYDAYTEEVEVQAGETTEADIEMVPSAVELEEVAVTALGFETDRDEQATSTSRVTGEDLAEAGEPSPIRSLSGKVAGVNITSSSGDPGAGARIQIRGQNTIQGDNQPLVVIDGVPVSNSTFGSGVAGVVQQSRLNDLNPNDIESVEVLKGAAASALYGSRAQNGVLAITTKSGAGQAGTNVTFRSSVAFDEVNRTVPLQQEFGQGAGGLFSRGTSLSWGDRIADREGGEDNYITDPSDEGYAGRAVGRQSGTEYYAIPGGTVDNPHGGKNSRETWDHAEDIFQTGLTLENNLSVRGGGEDTRYFLSLADTRQEGIIQGNSNYGRTSIRLNAERNVTDRFTVGGVANYVRSASDRIQQGSNISGLMLGTLRAAADFNNERDYLVDYEDPAGVVTEGRHRSYQNPIGSAANPGYDNPFFTTYRNLNTALVDRISGKLDASYDPLDWLNLTARLGLDTYSDRRQGFFPVFNASNPDGSAFEEEWGEYVLTADFIARGARDLNENVVLDMLLGTQLSHRETDFLGGELSGFTNPVDYRSLSNSASESITAETEQSVQRTIGFFGEAEFQLYDQLFLTATGRIDNSSTFGPEADNTFFYPSLQAAWQFSGLLPEESTLSFGKLRASYAEVGREPGPYLAYTYFNTDGFFDGYTSTTFTPSAYGGGFQRDDRLASPAVVPERKTEFEVGADLRFFDDRFGLSATFYQNKSEDLIFDLDTAPSSGFLSQTQNAATMENQGVELEADLNWLARDNFTWTTSLNWSANENTVTSLSGVREFALAGFVGSTSSVVEGEPFGVLYGNVWERYEEGDEIPDGFEAGDRVLDANGFPIMADAEDVAGDPNPDWRAGIGNTFTYGGLSLGVLVDVKMGGDVWNGTKGGLYFFGTHEDTGKWTTVSAEEAGTLTNYLGLTLEDMAASSGTVEQNDDGSYSFRGTVEDFGAGDVIVDEYYRYVGPGSGFTGPFEQFIEDGSYVRLREATLSYSWTGSTVERLGLASIEFTLAGRNLLLLTDYTGIDPETNLTGPTNGQGLDYFNNPATRSYRFSIGLNY